MPKWRVLIVKNDIKDDHLKWIPSINLLAEHFEVDIIDIFEPNWDKNIIECNYDMILAKPPGMKSLYKQVYDDRMELLPEDLRKKLYPTLTEIKIYENKRYLTDWLKVNNIPHPTTYVFLSRERAEDFIAGTNYPLVAKTNIGASGSGVRILRNHEEAKSYIRKTFSSTGAPRSYGPKFQNGAIFSKIKRALNEPGLFRKKLDLYKASFNEKQRDYVIFQEYIKHDFEWRIVCIGDSYFGHKKVKKGEKASGALIKEYGPVPFNLLNFCKNIMDSNGFYSLAIDIFDVNGEFLVNEMQCMFGQSDPHQMIIDGKPGRFRCIENRWQFEEGAFNGNESFDTRIRHIYEILTKRNP